MDYSGGGNWTMIPTHNTQSSNNNNPQDPLFLPPQQNQSTFQPQQQQQQQSPFHSPPQNQNLYQQQQQQRLLHQPQQPPPPQQQPQQNPHQSLASHFHLLHLMENLAETVEHGSRDQQSDALINELSNHFERCQQLLNSISGSLSTKAMTVEGQKKKVEESEQMLNQRRDLIANYRKSVEELVKSEP